MEKKVTGCPAPLGLGVAGMATSDIECYVDTSNRYSSKVATAQADAFINRFPVWNPLQTVR
jgi:hypothetical protein